MLTCVCTVECEGPSSINTKACDHVHTLSHSYNPVEELQLTMMECGLKKWTISGFICRSIAGCSEGSKLLYHVLGYTGPDGKREPILYSTYFKM